MSGVLHKMEDHKVATGVGALAAAGVAYKLYEHHETSKQEKSHMRLHIHLLRGTDLLAKDHHLFSHKSSDPYVKFKQGHLGIHSDTVKKNLNPEWNQTFDLGILDKNGKLHVEVYDKDLGGDDSMGHGEVDLKNLTDQPQDVEVKLHGDAGLLHKNHGVVHLRLSITGQH